VFVGGCAILEYLFCLRPLAGLVIATLYRNRIELFELGDGCAVVSQLAEEYAIPSRATLPHKQSEKMRNVIRPLLIRAKRLDFMKPFEL